MDEHHWKYRPSEHGEGIARDFQQQLKATTETPAPSICVLRDGVWCHVVGPWVAEEMLRLSRLVPEPVVEGEHRWRFKVGSGAVDNFRAVKGQGFDYARVEILLQGGAWDIFVGQPVAEEMLRLATENEELRVDREKLAGYHRELEVTAFVAWRHGIEREAKAYVREALRESLAWANLDHATKDSLAREIDRICTKETSDG